MGSAQGPTSSSSCLPSSPRDTKPALLTAGNDSTTVLRATTMTSPVIAERSRPPQFDLPTTLPSPPPPPQVNGDTSMSADPTIGDTITPSKPNNEGGSNNNNLGDMGSTKKVKYELDQEVWVYIENITQAKKQKVNFHFLQHFVYTYNKNSQLDKFWSWTS